VGICHANSRWGLNLALPVSGECGQSMVRGDYPFRRFFIVFDRFFCEGVVSSYLCSLRTSPRSLLRMSSNSPRTISLSTGHSPSTRKGSQTQATLWFNIASRATLLHTREEVIKPNPLVGLYLRGWCRCRRLNVASDMPSSMLTHTTDLWVIREHFTESTATGLCRTTSCSQQNTTCM